MNTETIGNIHSFETFSTVDGPGIRFVVFLQGCNLSCKYCHNKDTCSLDKTVGNKMTVEEVFDKIMHYKEFIINKGGVTISGGEPLLQAHFIIELFKLLKTENIHTAVDTASALPISEVTKELLNYTDLVLLDIKHIDNEKCIELTGRTNKYTLEFAKYLSDNNISMYIRQVLVPTITDDTQDLQKLKQFIGTLKTVKKVELLPYHSLGKYKWNELGIDYPLEGIRDANEDDVDKAEKELGLIS